MTMFFPEYELDSAAAIGALGYCNPFVPERIELERRALRDGFVWTDEVWHKRLDLDGVPPNVELTVERARELAGRGRDVLVLGRPVSDAELAVYEDLVLYLVYNELQGRFRELIVDEAPGSAARRRAPFYTVFEEGLNHYLGVAGHSFPSLRDKEHLFACFWQLRRAFHFIYDNIIGGSRAATRLRTAVWHSIFTHDMRRYRRSLYFRMSDIATLITGPSGTGKELVAQAIGMARYIPFNARDRTFTEDFEATFHPLNLTTLSPTLIESELFGHRKGSFTGALEDRPGWFEACSPRGSVFLDEIGDVDERVQVKLLRLFQTRTFNRIGETTTRTFSGKFIAATNKDLPEEIEAGRFRADFYYRLCSDVIETPALREQIEDAPEQLSNLVRFIAFRVAGPEEADALVAQVEQWIATEMPADYAWPGNVRELEQCVRNILVSGRYWPAKAGAGRSPEEQLAREVAEGTLTNDELLRRYYALVYRKEGTWQAASRALGVDARTVKARVEG